jgi:hypothetical protein
MNNRAEASDRFRALHRCVEVLAQRFEELEQLRKRVRGVEAAAIYAPPHQGSRVPALDSLLGGLGSRPSPNP